MLDTLVDLHQVFVVAAPGTWAQCQGVWEEVFDTWVRCLVVWVETVGIWAQYLVLLKGVDI